MIKFRFSIALLCIFAPPILYVTYIHLLEDFTESLMQSNLEYSYLGGTQSLIDGTNTLIVTIRENIERFMVECWWLKWGGQATVTVQTTQITEIITLGTKNS